MPDARPLFVAIAIEAAPLGVVRLARPAWRKSAYVATLVVDPEVIESPRAVPTRTEIENLSRDLPSRGN